MTHFDRQNDSLKKKSVSIMTIDTGIIAAGSLHYPLYKLIIMLKSAIIPVYTAYSSNK